MRAIHESGVIGQTIANVARQFVPQEPAPGSPTAATEAAVITNTSLHAMICSPIHPFWLCDFFRRTKRIRALLLRICVPLPLLLLLVCRWPATALLPLCLTCALTLLPPPLPLKKPRPCTVRLPPSIKPPRVHPLQPRALTLEACNFILETIRCLLVLSCLF